MRKLWTDAKELTDFLDKNLNIDKSQTANDLIRPGGYRLSVLTRRHFGTHILGTLEVALMKSDSSAEDSFIFGEDRPDLSIIPFMQFEDWKSFINEIINAKPEDYGRIFCKYKYAYKDDYEDDNYSFLAWMSYYEDDYWEDDYWEDREDTCEDECWKDNDYE